MVGLLYSTGIALFRGGSLGPIVIGFSIGVEVEGEESSSITLRRIVTIFL